MSDAQPELAQEARAAPGRARWSLGHLVSRDDNLVRLLLISTAVFATMAALNPGKFLSVINVESMAFQFPELGILSLGVLLAMITGGIDLSVVGVANLAGIFVALIFSRLMPPGTAGLPLAGWMALALAVALLTGALGGLLNAALIAGVGIPPILATLGTMQLFTGLAIVITQGYAVTGYPEAFLWIGNGSVGFLPVPFLVFLACAAGVHVLLGRTGLGVYLYMMGTNLKAAVFSGIETRRTTVRSYVLTGVLSGVAGIVMIARTNSAKADYGESYVLQAILVCVLGGVNPAGGFGTVVGMTIAVLALQFLSSGFNMLRFSNFVKEFTWGAFLLATMTLNHVQNRRKLRHRESATEPTRGGPP
jgi:simple sugar transport system permease protein